MRIIGIDTETNAGSPITFQFFGDDCGDDGKIKFTSSKNATRDFLKMLQEIIKNQRDTSTVLFGHNLKFDLVSIFHDRHFIFKEEEFSFSVNDWSVEGIYANVVFATLHYDRHVVNIIDTGAYFQRPLKELAEIFCPGLPKLVAPVDLGSRDFSPTDLEFVAYAMRDAEIAYHIGCHIIKKHAQYKVSLAVSAPHFASKIFRTKYLKKIIPLPSKKIVYSALHSYHGGKNNLAADPGWYNGVYSLDIVSAYPAAMKLLPSFSENSLYKSLRCFGDCSITWDKIPEFGIYRVWGETKKCRWPIIYDHHFKPIIGSVEANWITGSELREALRTREFKLEKMDGYFYDAKLDTNPSPFLGYVEEFFALKDSTNTEFERLFYKILMNSLYGKFIQSHDHTGLKAFRDLVFDLDTEILKSEKIIVAGGLFNPFIATIITGMVRAWIHTLEHKYKALHTATDGIFTQIHPKEIAGLGGQKIDCYGELLLIRNKCYIIYGKKSQVTDPKKQKPSKQFKGKYILKFAHHGFYGTVYDLERMYVEGTHEYEYTKVNKLKESLRRGLTVNKFEKRKAKLNF